MLYPRTISFEKFKIAPVTLNDIKGLPTTAEVFRTALKHYENNLKSIIAKGHFRRFFGMMALSKTGLKKEELIDVLESSYRVINVLMDIFKFCLLEHKNLYRVNNECYKRVIHELYLQEELKKNEIHSSIVTNLSKHKGFASNSRLIEEVTYNIYQQGN